MSGYQIDESKNPNFVAIQPQAPRASLPASSGSRTRA